MGFHGQGEAAPLVDVVYASVLCFVCEVRSGEPMAQNVFGSLSMAQLSLRLRRVSKTKQWEIFRRLMLVIFLISWFSMVMASVYVRLSKDAELSTSFTSESTTAGPLFRARKLAALAQQ